MNCETPAAAATAAAADVKVNGPAPAPSPRWNVPTAAASVATDVIA